MGLRGPQPKSAAELKLRGSTRWKQRLEQERRLERKNQPSKPLAEVPRLTDQVRAAVRGWGGSLAEIADQCGVPRSSLSRFMGGRGGLTVDGLERLCWGLDVGLYVILVDRCYAVDTQRERAGFRAGDLDRALGGAEIGAVGTGEVSI